MNNVTTYTFTLKTCAQRFRVTFEQAHISLLFRFSVRKIHFFSNYTPYLPLSMTTRVETEQKFN